MQLPASNCKSTRAWLNLPIWRCLEVSTSGQVRECLERVQGAQGAGIQGMQT